jgi:hypothetical protein
VAYAVLRVLSSLWHEFADWLEELIGTIREKWEEDTIPMAIWVTTWTGLRLLAVSVFLLAGVLAVLRVTGFM